MGLRKKSCAGTRLSSNSTRESGDTQRTIEVRKSISSGDRLAVELQSEFLALTDVPDFVAGPMKKGGRIFVNTFVLYELHTGKFARIRSAEFKEMPKHDSDGGRFFTLPRRRWENATAQSRTLMSGESE